MDDCRKGGPVGKASKMLSRFGVLAAVEGKKNAKMVSLSEGNEVRRDGWQEVGVLHMTCEVGEPSQRDPM